MQVMSDPFTGGPGGFDPRMSGVPFFREMEKILSWRGGPVNWDLARQTAASLAGGGEEDPGRRLPAGDRADEEFAAAVSVAELWLDAVTALPAVDGPARAFDGVAWTRGATTSEGLGVYVEPVADGMRTALGSSLPEELSGMLGGAGGGGADALSSMLAPLGAFLYGVQVGTVAGHLAGQLLGTYDLGLPTLDPRVVGTVGDSAARFATQYGVDPTELRHWLALREAAHRRQFAGVPWLRGHVATLISRFASAADFDPGSLMESLGGMGLDPTAMGDPERMREAMEQPDAFRMEPSTAQREVLRQLQALVSFTEGWVDTVVRAAAGDKLPALGRIEEAMVRRRAEKGPGERFLEQLVGLDLKPSDVRAGAAFCDAVVAARGQAGLDRAWRGAEHLPTPAEVADPSRWLVRLAADEVEPGDGDDLADIPEVPDDLSGLDGDGRASGG